MMNRNEFCNDLGSRKYRKIGQESCALAIVTAHLRISELLEILVKRWVL